MEDSFLGFIKFVYTNIKKKNKSVWNCKKVYLSHWLKWIVNIKKSMLVLTILDLKTEIFSQNYCLTIVRRLFTIFEHNDLIHFAFNSKELNLGMQEVFAVHLNILNINGFSTTV